MSEGATDSSINLRQAFGTFATGVTVVTATDGSGLPRGFTANSFTSVSLDPPLVLVCLAKIAATFPVFSACEHFCINVLAEKQQDVCQLFASPVTNRFEQISWNGSDRGCPILDGVVSWFECATHDVIDAGDHIIVIGRVLAFEFCGSSPLVYCAGSYVQFGLLQRAIEGGGDNVPTRIAAVINCGGQIVLQQKPDTDKWSLPTASRLGNRDDRDSLIGMLAANGIEVNVPFLCSVYEDSGQNTHNVVYRGSADSVNTDLLEQFQFVPLHEIPWKHLVDDALGMLLRRYIEENERDAFGVYVGDTEQGEVHTLRTT